MMLENDGDKYVVFTATIL